MVASGWRWSRDGRRILLVAYSRPDACALEPGEKGPAGDWEALWMIGDQPAAVLFTLLSVLLWIMHRGNIARLVRGTESKLGASTPA